MKPIALLNIRPEPHYRSEAFKKGLIRAGYTVSAGLRAPRALTKKDIVCFWNKKRGAEEDAADEWERHGGTVLVVENGYMGNKPKDVTHYAISVHGHNGSGWYPHDPSEDRFSQLGLTLKPPQSNPDGHWLVCGQRGIGSRLMASPPQWGERTVKKLVDLVGAKRVKFRPHPGNFVAKVPLKDDLKGARVCVIWSSASGITALIEGVTVQYSAPHWVAAGACVAAHDNRLAVLNRVAHGQWHVSEIEAGTPFVRIMDRIEEATW